MTKNEKGLLSSGENRPREKLSTPRPTTENRDPDNLTSRDLGLQVPTAAELPVPDSRTERSDQATPPIDDQTPAVLRSSAMQRSDETAKSVLLDALAKLHRNVSEAFEQEPDCASDPVNERERYAAALNSVAQYFSSVVGRPIADRFFDLASAIADLNNGTVHPLLQRVPPDNRASDPSQLWRARARVALGLEALLRSGLNQRDAAAKIASEYSSIVTLAGAKAKDSNLQTIVFGWRREFKARRVKNFEASELFHQGIQRIAQLRTEQEYREFASHQFTEAVNFSRVFSPST